MQRNNGNNNNNNNSVHSACAACKHQRKRCSDECLLAPYFPADRLCDFKAVHKVFGVSNITKMVRFVGKENGQKTADSLVWEAFCRQRDPVLGAYGEFKRVCEELKFYKNQALLQIQHHHHHQHHNQNQFVHGDMMYKPVHTLGGNGWNEANVMNVNKEMGVGGGFGKNNGVNYDIGDENLIANLNSFGGYSAPIAQSSKRPRLERDVIPVLQQQPQQQEVINGFNRDYYISGS